MEWDEATTPGLDGSPHRITVFTVKIANAPGLGIGMDDFSYVDKT
jgi:hypothetical protein